MICFRKDYSGDLKKKLSELTLELVESDLDTCCKEYRIRLKKIYLIQEMLETIKN